jgi:hypothetical protein
MPDLWLADILPVYGQISGLVLLTPKCVKGFLICSAGPRGLCGDPRIFGDLTKLPQVFRNPGGSPALQTKKTYWLARVVKQRFFHHPTSTLGIILTSQLLRDTLLRFTY